MNILFIFMKHSENKNDSTLTKDLSDEFFSRGNKVTVVTLSEKKYGKETEIKNENGYQVLRVKTGNYFNVESKLEKGITVLTMFKDLKKGIFEKIGTLKFDLIITHTPFLADAKLIEPLKKHYKCPAYLILWDIFPQNALDIGIIKNKLLFKYFKHKEKNMLSQYEKIFCMSEGNIDYVKEHYDYINPSKLKLLRNWAKLKPYRILDKKEIRKKIGFSEEDIIAVFGGNMGKPQKLENILDLAKETLNDKNIKFLFIGDGTERERLVELVKKENLYNVKFLDSVVREEYEEIVGSCDIALVSLDERFTIPNFPSKTTDYLKLKLPIFALLDECSAKDYGYILENQSKAGIFSLAKNKEECLSKFLNLCNNREIREKLGNNGRKYYEAFLGAEWAYKTIIQELGEKNV